MPKTRPTLALAGLALSLLATGCSGGEEVITTACSALESGNWPQLESAAEDLDDLEGDAYEDMARSMSYTAYQAVRTTPSNGITPPEMAEANWVEAFNSAWRDCAREVETFPEMSGTEYATVLDDLLDEASGSFG